VRDTVAHFAKYYSNPRDVDEVVSAVGLDEKSKELIRTLSGGQRRRLDVALGIIGSPELLFLDEPTTGFDPKARRAFWALIEDLRKTGTTILLTTHYLDEAEALADRVAVINHGLIVEVSTPALLGGRATSLATVSWLGADGSKSERTDNPTALIKKLTESFKGEIPELTVKRASLEDIYLEMIGGADEAK
jgi:ABC-2 type transport system ATP-binding protein